MKKLTDLEKQNWYKYHKNGGSNLTRCPLNIIHIGNETIKHELHKCLSGITLRKYGEIHITESIKNAINTIESEILSQQFMKNPVNFITEAVPNNNKKRRIDLVRLDTGEKIEFETSFKIDKSKLEIGVKTIYI